MKISGWGRYPAVECNLRKPHDLSELREVMKTGPVIARGLGRAYGDSALNEQSTIDMTEFNRICAFDQEAGVLTVEAGVSLRDVIEVFLPRGWFPPVTPGTKYVTIGGMIAADVHGKNHHGHGSFGNYVDWIEILGPDGEVHKCSRSENDELFARTLGGMGLTGIILRAAFRLLKVDTGWIRSETRCANNLAETMESFDSADDWTYSVAWIDCLARGAHQGRSVLHLGEHAVRDELSDPMRRRIFPPARPSRGNIPFCPPALLLRGWTVRAFNAAYFRAAMRRRSTGMVDWDTYFYPLDALRNWNRLYGRPGFAQFQCVLPLDAAATGLSKLLRTISDANCGSFLAVLKRFGKQQGEFSFPMPGYTLALDFPVSERTLSLMTDLDDIVVDHGGRFYLAKDSRMSRTTLENSDDRTDAFRAMREESGAGLAFASRQSERLRI